MFREISEIKIYIAQNDSRETSSQCVVSHAVCLTVAVTTELGQSFKKPFRVLKVQI